MRYLSERILLVDDEPAALRALQLVLQMHGFQQITTCKDSREVLALLRANNVGVILLDLMMPHIRGDELLPQIMSQSPQTNVIVITAENDLRMAVKCMKMGASDYLTKPVEAELLIATLRRTLQHRALVTENAHLREYFFENRLEHPEHFAHIITTSASMMRVFGYIEVVAKGRQSVLITGETGTGKEQLARALYTSSGCSGRFVAQNVAGLDDEMVSDTLFGHVAGAFTGAKGEREGLLEQAAHGILFLDEVGDLSETSQIKLLRVLQEREFFPLGRDKPRPLHARVVAATHRPLDSLRPDLLYRLRGYHAHLPPLRERPEDIHLLLDHFLAMASADLGCKPPNYDNSLVPLLMGYHFPGNVRELQSMIFHAVAQQHRGKLRIQSFLELMESKKETKESRSSMTSRPLSPPPTPLPPSASSPTTKRILTQEDLEQLERENLLKALEQTHWKVSGKGGAAELLGIKPTTLASRIRKFGLKR